MALESRQPTGLGFDGLYGLEMIGIGDGVVGGKVTVREELKQPAGLVHGGVYSAVAEALASAGTGKAVEAEGKMAVGLSNVTSFLHPITAGTIHARGQARHRGRTTWVWEVECSDDAGRLCVVSRVTVAVRNLEALAQE